MKRILKIWWGWFKAIIDLPCRLRLHRVQEWKTEKNGKVVCVICECYGGFYPSAYYIDLNWITDAHMAVKEQNNYEPPTSSFDE